MLGKGGMGSVYKARDRRLGRIVAIEFLLSADPNLTMRSLREARAQARIDSPNVCRVYEVGEVERRAYIVLQFINGEPLHKRAARMSLDEKVAVMRDVAVAVQEAHRLGIVHRDLKPANIMVERTGDGRWVPIVNPMTAGSVQTDDYTLASSTSAFCDFLFQPSDLPADKVVRIHLGLTAYADNMYSGTPIADPNPANNDHDIYVRRSCSCQ